MNFPGFSPSASERVRIPRRAFSRLYDLRPRLAVMKTLLDDWDWGSAPARSSSRWNAHLDDHETSPFELRRSYSQYSPSSRGLGLGLGHKSDDSFDWSLDDDLFPGSGSGRGLGGLGSLPLRRSYSSRKPRTVDELRNWRRQYFENDRDEHDDDPDRERPRAAPAGRQGATSFRSPNSRDIPVQAVQPEVRRDRVRDRFEELLSESRKARLDEERQSRPRQRVQEREGEEDDRPKRRSQSENATRNIRIELSDSYKNLRQREREQQQQQQQQDHAGVETDTAASVGARARARAVPVKPSPCPTATSKPTPPTPTLDKIKDKDGDAVADGTLVPQSELDTERRTLRELREENVRLKAVISSIQDVNKRWQTFNGDRQAYIQRLLTTIEEQQTQLNACLQALRESRPLSQSQSPHTTPTPTPTPTYRAPASTSSSTSSSSPAAPEVGDAGAVGLGVTATATAAPEARLRRLQREVADLQRRLDDAKREHKETMAVLQMQVDAHRDDWEAERREKCAAVADKMVAEDKLRHLAQKLGGNDTRDVSPPPPPSSSSPSHRHLSDNRGSSTEDANRRTFTFNPRDSSSMEDESIHCYPDDVVIDATASKEDGRTSPSPTPTQTANREDRYHSQYSYNSEALRNKQDNVRAQSPCLSDALTPTPTPTPHATGSGYPIEISGSGSSLTSASGPAPHISIPESSRDSTPDPDVSMCSDITLDCSPPSPAPQAQEAAAARPIQGTLTVGFNSDGLASVTSFRMRPLGQTLATVPASPDIEDMDGEGSEYGSCRSGSVEREVADWPRFTAVQEQTTTALSSPNGFLSVSRSSSMRGVARDARGATATTAAWRKDYWEAGAPTNTREDVICPSCGDVFPPSRHLQFLDHFEQCEKSPRQRRQVSRYGY